MKRLVLLVMAAFWVHGSTTAQAQGALLAAAGYAAGKATANLHLKEAKRKLASRDVAEATESVDKAAEKLKELTRMDGLQRDQKSAATAAKTKTSLAQKELEAARRDPKGNHLSKAAALVDEALERLK